MIIQNLKIKIQNYNSKLKILLTIRNERGSASSQGLSPQGTVPTRGCRASAKNSNKEKTMKILLTIILVLTISIQPLFAGESQPEEASKSEPATIEAAAERTMSTVSAASVETSDMSIGGSGMSFLQESFQTDLATGAATLSIPITIPPGRKNMQPKLSLSYSSNNSNGVCGVGWAIPSSAIQRSTKNGVPKYNSGDTFTFAGAGSSSELVSIGNSEYRAKIEGAFMKYVFSSNTWTVNDKSGTKYIFGSSSNSRLENGNNTFAWYLNKVEDVYGNYITYIYEKNAEQIYLKEIHYTGAPGMSTDKSVIFTYIDRTDKLSSYRSGWEIVTEKRLSSIEVKLNNNRVWLYSLQYATSEDTDRSLLSSITVYDKDENSLPPKTFTYQTLE